MDEPTLEQQSPTADEVARAIEWDQQSETPPTEGQLISEVTALRDLANKMAWREGTAGAAQTALYRAANIICALHAARGADAKDLRHFVDNNMTFMDVDADWPVEGPNIPTLAQVSNRIWYHATDDQTSYPFSAVIDAALAAKESPHG